MRGPARAASKSVLTDYENPISLGSRLRARRAGPLLQLIENAYAKYGEVRILDVGGRTAYWNILPPGFLQRHHVHVTLLNIPGETSEADSETFRHVLGDACNMPEYGDKSFHIAHSNSVIEHVGGWPKAKLFAKEMRRVASGLFVQTPYFWFPVEPHYVMPLFHWCPRPLQELMVLRLPLGYQGKKEPDWDAAMMAIDTTPRLLNLKAYRILFPDCTIIRERLLMFTKSLIAVRPV